MTAPLWFKAPFKILRLFVREKLRDRVYTVSARQLSLHVPAPSLPRHLGGQQKIEHSTWLAHCYDQQQRLQMTNREEGCTGGSDTDDILLAAIKSSLDSLTNNLPTTTSTTTTTPPTSSNAAAAEQSVVTALAHTDPLISLVASLGDLADVLEEHSSHGSEADTVAGSAVAVDQGEDAVTAVEKLNLQNNNNNNITNSSTNHESSWTENPPSSASSGFSDDESLAGSGEVGDYRTIDQVVEMVRERGRHGLMGEYAEIKMRAPAGTFTNARLLPNMHKNRYTDVLCYDHSRVVLSSSSSASLPVPSSSSPSGGGGESDRADIHGLQAADSVDGAGTIVDYINANFVDGYKQKNAYISTQGPLPKTSADFWRMVWEQQCLVIVMTTRVNERGRIKCGQYWDTQEDSAVEFGHFRIFTSTVQANEEYTVASLELTNLKVSGTIPLGKHFLPCLTWPLLSAHLFCRLRRRDKCPTGSSPLGRTTECPAQPWPCSASCSACETSRRRW